MTALSGSNIIKILELDLTIMGGLLCHGIHGYLNFQTSYNFGDCPVDVGIVKFWGSVADQRKKAGNVIMGV